MLVHHSAFHGDYGVMKCMLQTFVFRDTFVSKVLLQFS